MQPMAVAAAGAVLLLAGASTTNATMRSKFKCPLANGGRGHSAVDTSAGNSHSQGAYTPMWSDGLRKSILFFELL